MTNWLPENVFALTPGASSAAAIGVRATGSVSICFAVKVAATCGVSSTVGVFAVTVIASVTPATFIAASTRAV